MTNGEKIKATFPHYDIEIDEHKGYVRIFYENFYTTYPWGWWNSEYQEPTTKNDLGVDAVSRKELDKALYERFHDEDSPNNITEIRLGAVRDFIKNFPSVTSQTRTLDKSNR